MECTASGQVRYKQRLEDYLPLPVPMEAATNLTELSEYLARKAEAEAKGERLPGDDLVRAKIPHTSMLQAFLQEEVVEDFYSSAINSKTVAKKTIRMATFPDYLMVHLLKFSVDESWQPVKLDVEIDMPEQLDLSSLRGKGLQEGEVNLPEEKQEEAVPVNIDDNIVAQLVDMGFAREGCRRAVFNTGSSGVEAAMGWVMDHMGDPDFSSPFTPGGGKAGGAKKCTAGDEVIGMVMSMGFEREQAEMALRNTDNNVERAIEWIFSHPDGEDPVSEGAGGQQAGGSAAATDGEARYELSAFISHMGSSSHSGHYVCHVKDKEGKWVIFNDNKVAVSMKPPMELGYLYLYKRAGL